MEFFLGLLTMAVFLLCLYTAYKLGARNVKKTATPLSEEEKRRLEKFNKDFQAVLTYDINVAYGKKVK